jgi:hypothetical protein
VLLPLDEVVEPQLVASGQLLERTLVQQFASAEWRPRLEIEVAKPSFERVGAVQYILFVRQILQALNGIAITTIKMRPIRKKPWIE